MAQQTTIAIGAAVNLSLMSIIIGILLGMFVVPRVRAALG